MNFFAIVPLMVICGVLSAASMAKAAWDLNDVSILYPLPATMESQGLIQPEDVGRGGRVISQDHLDRVPRMSPFQTVEEERAGLRVLSIRIDPCFAAETLFCRRQIRLVWQSLGFSAIGNITTIDAAIHTFYDLGERDFHSFLNEWTALRYKHGAFSRGMPLGVHPVLLSQGLEGRFALELKKLILRYVGAANLTQVTFMLVRGPGIFWSFGGFEVDARGAVKNVKIPYLTEKQSRQGFANHSMSGEDFVRAQVAPVAASGSFLGVLLQGIDSLQGKGHEPGILSNLKSIHEIEDPRVHSPGTIDCVSCHVAQSARAFGERLFPSISALAQSERAPYINRDYNLTQYDPGSDNQESSRHTRNLRAFGYFGSTPAISRRVINESAEVARLLNTYF